jgi:transcriptional regulator of heat shock response
VPTTRGLRFYGPRVLGFRLGSYSYVYRAVGFPVFYVKMSHNMTLGKRNNLNAIRNNVYSDCQNSNQAFEFAAPRIIELVHFIALLCIPAFGETKMSSIFHVQINQRENK